MRQGYEYLSFSPCNTLALLLQCRWSEFLGALGARDLWMSTCRTMPDVLMVTSTCIHHLRIFMAGYPIPKKNPEADVANSQKNGGKASNGSSSSIGCSSWCCVFCPRDNVAAATIALLYSKRDTVSCVQRVFQREKREGQ